MPFQVPPSLGPFQVPPSKGSFQPPPTLRPPFHVATFNSPQFCSPVRSRSDAADLSPVNESSSAPDFKVYDELSNLEEFLANALSPGEKKISTAGNDWSCRPVTNCCLPGDPPLPPREHQRLSEIPAAGHPVAAMPAVTQYSSIMEMPMMRRHSVSYLSIAATAGPAVCFSPPPPPLPPRVSRGGQPSTGEWQRSHTPQRMGRRSPRIRMGSLSIRCVSMEVF